MNDENNLQIDGSGSGERPTTPERQPNRIGMWFRGIAGYVLIITAVIGLLLSLAGIVATWRITGPLERRLTSDLELAIVSLKATADGLKVADQSMQIAIRNSDSIRDTLMLIGTSLEETTPVIESINFLLSDNLPQTIAATQSSLLTAQSSAEIIDNVLAGLTIFIPGVDYRPETPLHLSLANVSASLNDVPATLMDIGSNITATQDNLGLIDENLTFIASQVETIETSLADAKNVIQAYQEIVADLIIRITDIQTNLPARIQTAGWILTLLFIWVGMTQVGLFFQGITLLNRPDFIPVMVPDENTVSQ